MCFRMCPMSTDYITSEPAVDFPLEDDYAFPVSTEPDTSTIKSHSKTLMFLQIIIGVISFRSNTRIASAYALAQHSIIITVSITMQRFMSNTSATSCSPLSTAPVHTSPVTTLTTKINIPNYYWISLETRSF